MICIQDDPEIVKQVDKKVIIHDDWHMQITIFSIFNNQNRSRKDLHVRQSYWKQRWSQNKQCGNVTGVEAGEGLNTEEAQ